MLPRTVVHWLSSAEVGAEIDGNFRSLGRILTNHSRSLYMKTIGAELTEIHEFLKNDNKGLVKVIDPNFHLLRNTNSIGSQRK